MKILAIAVAGALGAVSRYAISGGVYRLTGSSFPYGTVIVNVTGCFLIGLLYRLSEAGTPWPVELRVAVFIGFLGGYTTFSTFGYETFMLVRAAEFARAAVNVTLHLVAGLGSVWLGYELGLWLKG